MPGARCARSRVWCVESTRVSHHGHTGNTRHSPRNGFTAYIALSPVTGLVCHRRLRSRLRKLDASVGASGPHDFTVRVHAPSSEAPPASTASRPASVTIASRPSVGRDAIDIGLIWVCDEGKYFWKWDWTRQIRLIPFNNSLFRRVSPPGSVYS
jgi:hypothetical protein